MNYEVRIKFSCTFEDGLGPGLGFGLTMTGLGLLLGFLKALRRSKADGMFTL